ncbi:MAG: hypothetical protein LAO08_07725 [Acidobacteriia bacterium]|nr:hypothetical protein [Terriglobia bacterium]
MPQDDRDVLEVLKSELNFVQKGGYGRSPRDPFRAQLIFEDSLTCMNYDTQDHPSPCSECLLMQFVPPDKQKEKVPCRHIALTTDGQTVFDLYQGGATQPELEEALSGWLTRTIAQIEPLAPISQEVFPSATTEGLSA